MSKILFKFVQLSAQYAPIVTVNKKSEIVLYGEDNKLPNYLLDLSIKSSLHSAIIDKKVKMGVGEGIIYNGDDKKTENFIKQPNPYENLHQIFEKCFIDLEIFGGFALQVIWAKDQKTIAQIYHCPFQNIRSGKANSKNQIEEYFYFDDWSKYTRITDTQRFPAFNESGDKSKTQIMYCKKYNPTNIYYPLPSYIGALSDINTLYEISTFHNACISNNFQPGVMIIFRGPIPTEEEQEAIVKALEQKYKGSKNAGTPGILFLDTEQEAPQVEQVQVSDLDKQYLTLTEAVKENVILAHSIPRIVAGLEKPGSLGGSKEIIEANLVFYNEYVLKNQNFLLRHFNKICNINKLKELGIKNSSPSITLYSENLLREVLTRDEIRAIFGYEKLQEDKTSGVDPVENNTITNE